MSRYKRTHAIRGNVKIGRYLLESEIKHVLREFAKASREKKDFSQFSSQCELDFALSTLVYLVQ